MTMKTCFKCGLPKLLTEFPWHNRARNLRRRYCIACDGGSQAFCTHSVPAEIDVEPKNWRRIKDPNIREAKRAELEAMLAPPPLECLR